jgi:hypothetical protein
MPISSDTSPAYPRHDTRVATIEEKTVNHECALSRGPSFFVADLASQILQLFSGICCDQKTPKGGTEVPGVRVVPITPERTAFAVVLHVPSNTPVTPASNESSHGRLPAAPIFFAPPPSEDGDRE